MAQKHDTSDFDNTECIVFIDHSNLWIAGKTVKAKSLLDADSDPRYRVDLGRFLNMVLKGRSISNAFLYGSRPPPNDHVWNAARKKNFKVNIFDRSCKGKEKEVDVAMATEITKQVMQVKFDTSLERNIVFIVVTGDRDLTTPIKTAMEESDLVSVELWSWDQSMARDFRILANTEERFSVQKLDDVETEFSYKEYRSTRLTYDVDPSKTLIFPDVPTDKKFYYSLANDLCLLLRIFYIARIYSDSLKRLDLIVEFPNSTAEEVFSELKRCKIAEKPISYPEYMSTRKEPQPKFRVTNRFEALGDLEDSDEEALSEAIESSLNIEPDDIKPDTEKKEQSDTWVSVVRKKAGKRTIIRRRHATPCKWGIHCAMAYYCSYYHNEKDRKIFHDHRHTKFKYWKTRLCDKITLHTDPERQTYCCFAHNEQDSWCLKCKIYGHLTDKCKA